nr:hypothetical protein [Tanacetum cinerariifolium]
MKEKGDRCILVGYSTQSNGYRVYNKRTKMIVESIHIRFDEIKEVSETQDVYSSADADVPSQQELDMLFGPLYDEFFNTDHPLEQVLGNPSRPVQTRRQLATDPKMCMYALTVGTAELKNIKEAMADSAWIEAMQEELHQFDRLQAILSGVENRPPMLEKDMYDSWRSRMELYMLNRQHGRIILESIEHGPLIWPSVTEDGVTRLKNILNCRQLKLFKPIAMLKQQISFFKHSL